ncbi:M48 family metalloprotease [Pseudodesulfovibrio alkaliphilus]|nr:M48 family metalloprotease [Pseudodesulfovibrio alkaliphilus]
MMRTYSKPWTRRRFIKAGAMAAALMALGGCAKNPVTGRSQLMLVSETEEISMDTQASPHQISADYGRAQDEALNAYVSEVGHRLADLSHRPEMPYNFQVVNATYVNAYAFPGGTIACTRGIMLDMENEAEMAALLGHEIGHVNARHTASRMSNSILVSLAAGVGGALVGAKYGGEWGALAGGLGGFGAGMLLAAYSRQDERQADSLGMEYMTRAEYNPDGMAGLMDMLNAKHDREPNALEVMFATHPMSSERLATARTAANTRYPSAREYSFYRERYMDNTASLRSIEPAVRDLQTAEKFIVKKEYPKADEHIASALSKAPNDYVGLLLMAKSKAAQGRYSEGIPYAERAREAHPGEPQALQLNGLLQVRAGNFSQALSNFTAYEAALPGNPYSAFYKGYSKEGMGDRRGAAEEYVRFLGQVNQGDQAKHAYYRLVEWGYVKGRAEPVPDPFKGLA